MTNTFRTVVALTLMAWLSSQAGAARQSPPAHGQHDGQASMMSQMVEIHDLFSNHDKMTRTVMNLPNGVRTVTESTVTESSDPRVAQLLKDHVASSRQRVESGVEPGLPIESDALRAIYANYKKIQTTVETTATGVIVVQTSDDPATVTALQQHASEVTTFVDEGMEAMHKAMMKKHGMPGGMRPGSPR
jgi:hypothetical protein